MCEKERFQLDVRVLVSGVRHTRSHGHRGQEAGK
jgi:hypothetical protein